MQQAPLRLSQTLWSAFRAAKPVHAPITRRPLSVSTAIQRPLQPWSRRTAWTGAPPRFYSDIRPVVDKKVEEAKGRVEEEPLDAATAQLEAKSAYSQDESTVHASSPESASTLYTSSQTAEKDSTAEAVKAEGARKSLPSDLSSRYSQLRQRFTHFMDDFQSHLFVASQRLNDLTGYSGIEALKKEIEKQEIAVQDTRRMVTEARAQYAEAIATRSTTQREVNDLLHRKHTWNPTDVERFTSLYRSDHANEQAEAAAQKAVSDSEAKYEEASTKLARSILARYHEEQIWSDKIRQMSTWGTWGLMGLNVLLFVVLQIAVEPWRRQRLVKGFEEKVELALKEKDEDRTRDLLPPSPMAALTPPEEAVETVAEKTAGAEGQLLTAVTGLTATSDESPTSPSAPISTPAIESAPGTVTSAPEIAQDLGSPEESAASPVSGYAYYEDRFRELFSDEKKVVLTQRELSTIAIEGVAGGAALMGLLFVLFRSK